MSILLVSQLGLQIVLITTAPTSAALSLNEIRAPWGADMKILTATLASFALVGTLAMPAPASADSNDVAKALAGIAAIAIIAKAIDNRKDRKRSSKAAPGLISGQNRVKTARMGGSFETAAEVLKVDDELGIVFGWGIVCKDDGEDYFDTQGDHIPEDAMLKATSDFMFHFRTTGEMHARGKDGEAISKGVIWSSRSAIVI